MQYLLILIITFKRIVSRAIAIALLNYFIKKTFEKELRCAQSLMYKETKTILLLANVGGDEG